MKEENNVNVTPEVNQEPQQSVTPVNTLDQQRVEMEQEMMKENLVPPAEPIMPDAPEIAQPVAQPAAQPAPVEPQIDPSFGTNVTPPVQPVPEPTKKKSKLPVIIIVLVILAGGGFACWKFVLPMLNKETTGGEETTTTAIAEAKVEELTDATVKARIDKAIKIYETDYITRRLEDLYSKETYKIATDEDKLDLILINSTQITDSAFDAEYKAKEHKFSEKVLSEYSQFVTGPDFGNGYVKADEAAKLYKEIFNEDMKKVDILNCPSYAYDELNDVYVDISACGGDDGLEYLTYTYKYELETKGEEKTAYAYVAVGYYDDEVFDDNSSYLYYSFIDKENKEVLADGEPTIDASNYEKFDKFKYVFKYDKATNNYYVDHIERVK